MALIARAQVRNFVLSGIKGIGLTVFRGQVTPLAEKDLPALLIYYDRDALSDEENANIKTLSLIIEPVVKASPGSTAEDALDGMCLEIMTLLENNRTLDDRILNSQLISTEFTFSGGGERYLTPVLSTRMNWDFLYKVKKGSPEILN